MIKIYGMPTCPYCDYIHEQVKGRENEFEYINIGENIRNMSIFTRMRDTSPVFDHCKEIGDVGVPAFVTTLAGMFIFRGLLLLTLASTGTIIIRNATFNSLSNGTIPDFFHGNGINILTLAVGAIAIILIIVNQLNNRAQRQKYGFKVWEDEREDEDQYGRNTVTVTWVDWQGKIFSYP